MSRLILAGGIASVLAVPATASANPSNFEQGQAFDIGVGTSLLPPLVVGPNTGFINTNQSSNTSKTGLPINLKPLLTANALNASVVTTAATETATSTASIADVTVNAKLLPAIAVHAITASSTTTCRAGGTVSGGSVVGTLDLGSRVINLAAPANTTINLGIAKIVINEQTPTVNGLAVYGVHISSPLLGLEVVVGYAESGVTNCAG